MCSRFLENVLGKNEKCCKKFLEKFGGKTGKKFEYKNCTKKGEKSDSVRFCENGRIWRKNDEKGDFLVNMV